LSFSKGSQCHFVFLYFSVNTSIVSEFGFIVNFQSLDGESILDG
jgi:hypothetical protein